LCGPLRAQSGRQRRIILLILVQVSQARDRM